MLKNDCDSLIIRPSDDAGGVTPTPRKLSAASARMADPMPMASSTTTGWNTLGRMWRQMIRLVGTPTARAASTYSSSLTWRNPARTTRAVCNHAT